MQFELICDANVLLAETPIWDNRNGKLYWTDLFRGDIYEFDPGSKTQRKWETGKLIGSAIPCEDPDWMFAALEDGMYRLNLVTGEQIRIADPEPGNDQNRYNDTRIDAAGRIFTSSVSKTYGTSAYTPDQRGNFYMIDLDGSVHTILSGINQLNCIVWNADSTRMYVADTYNQTLLAWEYDLATGPVGEAQTVLEFRGKQGTPDGLSMDVEDNLYICHWSGVISVWDKGLSWKEDIPFPVEQVCCGGFGGVDMKDFYVATARYDYTPQQMEVRRGAGGLFVARSEIAGRGDPFLKI